MPQRPKKTIGEPTEKPLTSDQPERPLHPAPMPAADEPVVVTTEANGNGAGEVPAEIPAEAVALRRMEGEKV